MSIILNFKLNGFCIVFFFKFSPKKNRIRKWTTFDIFRIINAVLIVDLRRNVFVLLPLLISTVCFIPLQYLRVIQDNHKYFPRNIHKIPL